jgi:DNA recombination protein Rad52
MTDWNEISAKLDAKLDPKHVKPAKSFGPKGDYIEGWHAMAEANRIFGHDGWTYQVTECTCVNQSPRAIGREKKDGFGVTYTAKVSVNVLGVIREDFGAGHGYDVDCGLAHESAIKEAVTDALKRALRSFGNPFGLALYDKTRENVGAPEPEKPARDPRKIADWLIGGFNKARDFAAVKALQENQKNVEAWEWLELEKPAMAAEVKKAETAALARVDPAMQRPADDKAA